MRSIVTLAVFSAAVCSASVQAASLADIWQQLITPEQQAAHAASQAANAQARLARHAWVPNVSISGRSTWLTDPLVTTTEVPPMAPGMQPLSLQQTLRPEQFNQASLQADWLLYGGGQVRHQAASAASLVDAAQAKAQATTLAQLPVLVRRYRTSQLAHQQVSIRQQAVQRLSQHLHRSEQMLAQGQLAEIDVLKVRTDLAMAEQWLVQANNDLVMAQLALTTLIGEPITTSGQMPLPRPPILDVAQVTQSNPNLQALTAAHQAALAQANASRGSLLPSVYAFAKYELLPDELAANEPQTAFGIGWQWQLIDRRGRYQQWQQAHAKADEVLYQQQAAQRDITLAIAQQQNLLRNALEQVTAIEQRLTLASQQRRLANQSFNAGLATVQDITDAELNHAAIALEQQNAVLQAHIALAELAVLSGDDATYFSAI